MHDWTYSLTAHETFIVAVFFMTMMIVTTVVSYLVFLFVNDFKKCVAMWLVTMLSISAFTALCTPELAGPSTPAIVEQFLDKNNATLIVDEFDKEDENNLLTTLENDSNIKNIAKNIIALKSDGTKTLIDKPEYHAFRFMKNSQKCLGVKVSIATIKFHCIDGEKQ